jgi:predicted ATPase
VGFRAHPGARLGVYEVVTELGRGGMGQVLLARDTRIGRSVALKILPAELMGDSDLRARFLREARIAANLEHPNVVPVYDIGEEEDLLYIAMRYVSGQDLRHRLVAGPLDPAQALAILTQIASALDAAHTSGLIHRDVKPGNILLTEPAGPGEAAHAYLADFGLAAQTVLSDIHTNPGTILGTIDYAAPEQLEGRPLDGRADVYALGAVLFESLTGAPPFKRPTSIATIAALLSEPAPLPSQLRADLPTALDAVTTQALAKSREDRFRTCTDLITASRDAIAGVASPTLFVPSRVGEIPVPLTSFVGRDDESATLRRALGASRLVTLTGPGGAGKTRLAIEIARAWQSEGSRVSYLDLAVEATGEIGPSIRAAIGPQDPHAGASDIALVVLDDCERHVDELVPLLGALIAQSAGLVVLVTSRESLGVPGERTVLLETLALPPPGSEAKILETAAGQLFWDRATAVDPSLEPTPSTLRAIARICLELDGIPLAIELAASRVRGLPLEEIADRIVRHPDLLSDPGAPERQRTISAAISWSHDLLAPEERALFRRLAVFAGAFTLEDVEVVCSVGLDPVADVLARLVERSLVVMRRENGSTYRLLGPLARFARDQLVESDDEGDTRRRHAEWFLSPLVADSVASASDAARVHSEVASALRWVEGREELSPALRELAGRAAVVLGAWSEAVALLEPLVEGDDPRVLEGIGVALCKIHRDEPATPAYARGQQLLARSYEQQPNATTLSALAGTWKGLDDQRAHALYGAAAELDASDSYALGNLLEYEVEAAHAFDCVEARRGQIDAALLRCRADAERGRNLPWAAFDEGKLLALLGQTMPSLNAHLRAVLASSGSHAVETSLRSLERIVDATGTGTSVDLAARLLRLAYAARSGRRDSEDAATEEIAIPPVVIVAGNSSGALHRETVARVEAIAEALQGFGGTLIGGGTTSGVSFLVGDLTAMLPRVQSVGYLPAVLGADFAVDQRYSRIRRTDGDDFGPAEPLAYWRDLLAADIAPAQVAVLAIGGGEIAAFEYRLALALGGWVGVLRETGHEAAKLLADPVWSASRRLFEVPSDGVGIRRFLRRSGSIIA